MPVFVHLTSHRNLESIRRGGIGAIKKKLRTRGVYALPVTRNFQISHQWLRELRRQGGGTIFGVYFRIPDDEPVEIGHFGSIHLPTTAAEAVALMMSAEEQDPGAARAIDKASKAVRQGLKLPSSPEGFEVIVPRVIAPSQIVRVKALPQIVGWRYRPGANGSKPCICICCERGSYGARKLLARVEEAEAGGRTPDIEMFGRDERSWKRVERMREARKKQA